MENQSSANSRFKLFPVLLKAIENLGR